MRNSNSWDTNFPNTQTLWLCPWPAVFLMTRVRCGGHGAGGKDVPAPGKVPERRGPPSTPTKGPVWDLRVPPRQELSVPDASTVLTSW